jgi:hypothetical protein
MELFLENFVLTTVMGLLAGLKKAPASIPKLKTILVHVLNDVCEILGVEAPIVP